MRASAGLLFGLVLVAACASAGDAPPPVTAPPPMPSLPQAVFLPPTPSPMCYFTTGPGSYYVAPCDSDLGGKPVGNGWEPPTARQTVLPTSTPPPRSETAAPTPQASDPFSARSIGTSVTSTNFMGSATIAPTKYTKATTCGYVTAPQGTAFIEVSVAVSASAGSWTYGGSDFAVHDVTGYQRNESLAWCHRDAELGYGTLTSGRHVAGWVGFDVPTSVKPLWLDYRVTGALQGVRSLY